MKLKVRLTLWFLAISLIPMSLVMYFSYSMTRSALLVQICNRLESLANVQQSRVETLIGEQRNHLLQITDRPQLRALLERYIHGTDASARGKLEQLLAAIRSDHVHYREITLLDLQGNVIASTEPRARTKHFAEAPWFIAGSTQSDVTLEYEESDGGLHMRVAGPLIHDTHATDPQSGVLPSHKRLVGVCLLVTDGDALLNLAADRTGLGESGELFIARNDPGQDVLALTPVRQKRGNTVRLRVQHVDHDSLGAHDLTAGNLEVHDGIDLHGASVLAASRQLGITSWALVVTLDKNEAMKPIHQFRDLVLWAMVALTLLTVLASFSLARSITEPLDDLTLAAERASGGDLSTRVTVTSEDELGVLGRAFNHMSERLDAMHQGLESTVTERTAELEAANVRLRELDQLKSEFLATMTHELRTPLNSILGFSELLLSDSENLEDEQREHLRCIFGSAEHLLKIIEEILDVSKIEAGKMTTEPQWFSATDLARQAVDIMRPLAKSRTIDIGTVVESPEPLLVYSDPHRLLRTLVNLVGNAVKFTHKGAVTVTVRVEDGPLDGTLVFAVRDTGIGIRADDLRQLFHPFQQVDSSTRRQYEGTGLGLYYSKKVVDLLGGRIDVESVWQQGSTFTVRIPIRTTDTPPRPEETDMMPQQQHA